MFKYVILLVAIFALAKSDTPATNTETGFVPSSVPYPAGASSQSTKNNQDVQTYSQVLENPSYDPNLYSNFVPHDAVQQYVSSYGGPYAPQSYQNYNPDPSGFTVQTGYEGYLVPSVPHATTFSESLSALGTSLGFGGSQASGYSPLVSGYSSANPAYTQSSYGSSGLGSGFASRLGSTFGSDYGTGLAPFSLLTGLLPLSKTIIAILVKVGAAIFATVGIVFVGGIISLLLCTFTSVCWFNIPFLPNWQRAVQGVSETIGEELTSERVKRATEFVKAALEKYQQMQETNTKKDEEEQKKIN